MVPARNTVLDGEIVCIDADGRLRFYDLLYRRGTPLFFAFDVLVQNSEDLRYTPLIDRRENEVLLEPTQLTATLPNPEPFSTLCSLVGALILRSEPLLD